MNKIITLTLLLLSGFTATSGAANHTNTVTLGYANLRMNGELSGNAIGGNLKYHWDAVGRGVGILGSATYTGADMTGASNKKVGNVYQYSIMAGPSYRFNDYVSVYALAGMGNLTVKLDNLGKQTSNSFAYGFGAQVNPAKNWVLDMSYEFSQYSVDLPNSAKRHNAGTLVFGGGYRF